MITSQYEGWVAFWPSIACNNRRDENAFDWK